MALDMQESGFSTGWMEGCLDELSLLKMQFIGVRMIKIYGILSNRIWKCNFLFTIDEGYYSQS